jgi:hypothetical protein
MKVHLALDAVSGATLAAVPWATGARKRGLAHWLPHTAIGAFEIAMALMTKSEPPPTKVGRLRNLLRLKR